MDKLPFEVLLQIFEYLPISNFKVLYGLYPKELVDEALIYKLKRQKKRSVIKIVSTNMHELSSMNQIKNQAFISLYYASFDIQNRVIWFLPDFVNSQHYFKVKDAYVSHGKLTITSKQSIILTSLWDIRKTFPPIRAGSFSGASEYTNINLSELTIYQPSIVLDTCLLPLNIQQDTTVNKKLVYAKDNNIINIPRPALPCNYKREIPKNTAHHIHHTNLLLPHDLTCGYFLVERLALTIPTFLDLF